MTEVMRNALLVLACGAALAAVAGVWMFAANEPSPSPPKPATRRKRSVEEVLAARRSVREFTDAALGEQEIAQLCWAAQGITDPKQGFRTAPSAGATYPLELYVVTADRVRRHVPDKHELVEHLKGDVRRRLRQAALDQRWVESAPAVFVIAADVQRTARRYGQRAERYVLIEVGHAAQNLLLQAEALGLGGVSVGAFEDDRVGEVLWLPQGQRPLYLLPVGKPGT